MPSNSVYGMFQQTLGLIGRAFISLGKLIGILFIGFLRISPLPDQVDFVIVCLFLIWLVYFLIRVITGKSV